MDIKLYYTPKTRALRVRWLLEELGLDYRLEYIDILSKTGNPEYKKIHPLGSVPAIEIDGKTMFETGAICAWLTDQFPEKNMAPTRDSWQRALYEQWMYFVPGTMEPPIFDYVLHSHILPEEMRIKDCAEWSIKRYHSVLKVLNTELEKRAYILGDSFTTADLMISSVLFWKRDVLENYSALKEYTAIIAKREAFRTAKKD